MNKIGEIMDHPRPKMKSLGKNQKKGNSISVKDYFFLLLVFPKMYSAEDTEERHKRL